MSKTRRAKKPMPVKAVVPFGTAEEAWFWFVRSERARRDGARLTNGDTCTARPCDPDDIYRAVMKLHRSRRLSAAHLKVLAQYGWRDCPPDHRVREETRALVLWEEALDRLTTELADKGVVVHGAHMDRVG